MSVLRVVDLHASVEGNEILRGVDFEVQSGEVHAVMGPNGSGKSTLSHVLMGRGDYEVTAGSVTIDGEELLGLPTHERAARGLFLALQYPVELPGVRLVDFLAAALIGQGRDVDGELGAKIEFEAARLGVAQQFLDRGVNVEFSGGEQKRAETLQLAVLEPRFAVLDEIDSGLDVDALRDVARRIEAMTTEGGLGVLAITHYARVLERAARRPGARVDGRAHRRQRRPRARRQARRDGLRRPRGRARRRDARRRAGGRNRGSVRRPVGF